MNYVEDKKWRQNQVQVKQKGEGKGNPYTPVRGWGVFLSPIYTMQENYVEARNEDREKGRWRKLRREGEGIM